MNLTRLLIASRTLSGRKIGRRAFRRLETAPVAYLWLFLTLFFCIAGFLMMEWSK